MLKDTDVITNVAVADLGRARKFYEEIIGLTPVGRFDDNLVTYTSGRSSLYVYKSEYAGTNKATALTWRVGSEIDAIVRSLKANGVTFEHYDFPGMKLEGDIHVAENMKIAWFKDPDGNILSLVS